MSGSTLFGVPTVDDDDLTAPLDPAGSGPMLHEDPNAGPPEISLSPTHSPQFGTPAQIAGGGDIVDVPAPVGVSPGPGGPAEFHADQIGSGGALELDLAGGAPHDGELDLDLPVPVGASPPPIPVGASPPPESAGLDLPAPARSSAPGAELQLPTALSSPAAPASDLDLPLPTDDPGVVDLPAPARTGGNQFNIPMPPPPPPMSFGAAPPPPSAPGAGRSADILDLPAPVGSPPGPPPPPPQSASALDSSVGHLDLPMPAGPPSDHSASALYGEVDLPVPAGVDLPAPKSRVPSAPELDLPVPVETDLLTPVGESDLLAPGQLNLPVPSDLDLEPAQILPTPASLDVEPAEILPEPANLGVEPANLGVAPKTGQRSTRGRTAGEVAGIEEPQAADDLRRSPTPKSIGGSSVSRGLIFGGLAVVFLAAVGGGLVFAGVFDDPAETPPSGRGTAGANQGTPQSPGKLSRPRGPAAERSPAILAKFDLDQAAPYREAFDAAQGADDRIGQAEAGLLLHLRYGPHPVLFGQAASLLQPYEAEKAEHIRRVLGLRALAGGNLDQADKALTGEQRRTRLYRGWLRIAQGRPEDAREEAAAILETKAGDLGGSLLQFEADLATDPLGTIPRMDNEAEINGHAKFREALARAATRTGFLAIARKHVDKIDVAAGESEGYKAKILGLKATLANAGADYPLALKLYKEAVALAPKSTDLRIDQIRTMVAAQTLRNASLESEALLAEHGKNPDIIELRAEVALATGDTARAEKMIAKLKPIQSKQAAAAYLQGQALAMKMQIEEGSAAFAKALSADPTFYRAHQAEAKMLVDAKKPGEAVKRLDLAIKSMPDARARPKADLSVTKARIQLRQGQTRAALASMDLALTLLPIHNEAALLRGTTRIDMGEYEEGKADLLEVYARTAGYPGLTSPLGEIFAREQRVEDLEKLVGDRADHPGSSADIKLVGARLRLAQGRIDDAKVLIDQAMAKDPAGWEAHVLMAQAFLDGGDPGEALQELNLARPRQPNAELYFLRGKVLEFLGRHSEAQPEYLKALSVDPQLEEARFLYGRLLAYSGKSVAAVNELSKVVAQTERFPAAFLNLARAQRDIGKDKEAAENLAKALALDPKLYEANYQLGRLFFEKNQHAKAVSALRQALNDEAKVQPWFADGWMYLGRSQAKLGQREAAKESFQRFLDSAAQDHASRTEAQRQLRSL